MRPADEETRLAGDVDASWPARFLLVTYFVLLRAPLTTDLSGWRAATAVPVTILTLAAMALAVAGRFQTRTSMARFS